PVGPGRGSGVGSLAAYLTGITEIDPVQNGLLFERFLNPERVSMPDFDIDFCDERRYEVIDYVKNKYGEENFAQIINFGTFAGKQALRDAFKVCALPFSEDVPAKVAECAKLLEGRPRNVSQHASGVVIVGGKNKSERLIDHIPLYMNGQSKVTQFDMVTVEKLGLLKIDFLGLRFLTLIDNCEKSAGVKKEDYGALDDAQTYAMLCRGSSSGLFQLESEGMQKLLRRALPKNIRDIAAVISLYRPGPSRSIETYLRNKNYPSGIKYINGAMRDILSETYGCILYQEQVMEICRRIASFTYGHADIVRKAMAKKDKDVMEKERVSFIEGASKNGVDIRTAEELFDTISGFAEYAFNKSHAAAYSVLAYRTAYLKCHHPREYMASLLTSVYYSNDKKYEYAKECRSLGIGILPPDINKSRCAFCVEGNGIRFGLQGIKNVGEQLACEIEKERDKNGDFTSVSDLASRLFGRISRGALISLAMCGAFLSLGQNRKTVVSAAKDGFYDSNDIRVGSSGQMSLFGAPETPDDVEEYTDAEIRDAEIELTGLILKDYLRVMPDTTGKTLYIKITDKNASVIDGCLELLGRDPGDVPVVLYYSQTGKMIRSKQKFRLTEQKLKTLKERLGSENCVVK
ncbi:MAG: DNA polymerase III subunit alpha, partial [Clostridia bacterium]|nr:DNA polymerase III subunit alpha [Clostridia bacterium]